jgi:hypothetical protein
MLAAYPSHSLFTQSPSHGSLETDSARKGLELYLPEGPDVYLPNRTGLLLAFSAGKKKLDWVFQQYMCSLPVSWVITAPRKLDSSLCQRI